METTEQTVVNNYIELAIVRGATSGQLKLNRITGEIEFSDDVSYEQWLEVLATAKTLRDKAAVAVACCMSYGKKRWGEVKVNEGLEQLEFEATLVKSAIAINSIPKALLHENLDEDHYVELAKANLTPAQAKKWAKIAADQRLTASQLRASIKEGEVVDREATKALQHGLITIQGIRQEFDIWARRVGGIDGIKKMDMDNQVEIMEELSAICDLGFELHAHLSGIQEAIEQPPAA